MMFCNKCGKELDDNVKFCPECGKKFKKKRQPEKKNGKTKKVVKIAILFFCISCTMFAFRDDIYIVVDWMANGNRIFDLDGLTYERYEHEYEYGFYGDVGGIGVHAASEAISGDVRIQDTIRD